MPAHKWVIAALCLIGCVLRSRRTQRFAAAADRGADPPRPVSCKELWETTARSSADRPRGGGGVEVRNGVNE